MDSLPLVFLLFITIIYSSIGTVTGSRSTIAFTSLGRSRYGFDIFAIPISTTSSSVSIKYNNELQLTDGVSVNFNGFFLPSTNDSSTSLLYVSERHGVSNIYLDNINHLYLHLQHPILPSDDHPPYSMKDRPSLVGGGDHLVYVSTHEQSDSPRQSWAAVYSTHLPTKKTLRLTPPGISDFSPSVSPSGTWTAVASSGVSGWSGEVQELKTSIYVFKTADGSKRTLLVEHGGWPAWADDSTIYFHRQSPDGWWSVYRARISTAGNGTLKPSVVSVDRITPPGFHAFTPAATVRNSGILAVATRRPGSEYRHIELLVSVGTSYEFVEVTRPVSPYVHHYNPFISPDGKQIGYHRCRGGNNGNPPLLLENIKSPSPEAFSLFRIDGSFPSFSHDGERIAYVNLPGVYVVNSDGSGEPRKVFAGNAFPTAWDWKREGVIYTSHGPDFATERTKVDIVSITLNVDDDSEPSVKKLTHGGENNAFPSPSPDGKWLVFRSGRSGHKNLYIMDAAEGEDGGIYRLTEGPWSDTMCNWSPDGKWIAFASDRDSPGSGSFAMYMVHPDGTELRKVFHSGDGGRTNHPWFGPDSKTLVFTSDYGGVSAEPISNPHHYQPYGEIFTVNVDGSGLQRLTYNSYEDGTPTWSPFFLKPIDVAESLQGTARCKFDDCHWLTIKEATGSNAIAVGNGC
ncbi:putative protein TolB [Iris pallida]|uniref:Uncharacterized protein n=1 Tax=Iris pallida TaxID=29817 RepID=A0AAX6H9H9_IRIPA|nr:putative protein TolB [Iris pallida]